jgi:hypothetical protein
MNCSTEVETRMSLGQMKQLNPPYPLLPADHTDKSILKMLLDRRHGSMTQMFHDTPQGYLLSFCYKALHLK